MSKDYLEVSIKINPACSELASDVLFSNFDCEGIVTSEEAYKDLELISTTEDYVKGYIVQDEMTFDEIETVLKSAYNELLDNGISKEYLGDWNVTIKPVENQDWSKKWKENWQPTKITDKVVISPSWIDYQKVNDEIVINIDPGAAFGTGTHATTQLCVMAIEKYMQKADTVADIGTGSGILAIAASLFGASKVIGIDNDPVAVEVAEENAKINNIKNCTFLHQEIDKLNEQFDFITANILHNVLADIMCDLARIMKDGAKLVLSGILDTKQDIVKDAVLKNNLKIIEIIQKDQWVAIIVQK